MYITCKIALKPNKEQEKIFWSWANATRFVYNFALDMKSRAYQEKNISVSWNDIVKIITRLKRGEEYKWLLEVPSETIKYAVKDMDNAFKKFFSGAGYPKFKRKNKTVPSFYTRYDKLHSVDDRHIKICGLKKPIKTYEKCLIPKKPMNPRIKYDGKYWYLTYGVELIPQNRDIPIISKKFKNYQEMHSKDPSGPLGIDLGIINTAVCSNGVTYSNINRTNTEIVRLMKKKKRLQRKLSRKYIENNKQFSSLPNELKKGQHLGKSNNIIKLERQIKLTQRRINNIRNNFINEMTIEIVKTKPSKIVIEDLAVSNMMKNVYLAKSIQEQKWYDIRRQLEYKSELYGVPLQAAKRFYASSKIYSNCGHMNKQLTLRDRVYICPYCKLTIDRDYNASINLSRQ